MAFDPSPSVLIQRQLDAYNAKDLDAWLDTDAVDAKQFELGGSLLASGLAEGRACMEAVCICVVEHGRIQTASFLSGPPVVSDTHA